MGALVECPLMWLVVDGAAVGEQANYAAVLTAGLGRPAPDPLPTLDALEVAVAALATAVPASATVVVRVRFFIDAYERRSAAQAVALEAPLGLISGGGGSGGSGSGGGAVCLSRCHAMELHEVQDWPAIVVLAESVAAVPNDVLVLGVALSLADNVAPL